MTGGEGGGQFNVNAALHSASTRSRVGDVAEEKSGLRGGREETVPHRTGHSQALRVSATRLASPLPPSPGPATTSRAPPEPESLAIQSAAALHRVAQRGPRDDRAAVVGHGFPHAQPFACCFFCHFAQERRRRGTIAAGAPQEFAFRHTHTHTRARERKNAQTQKAHRGLRRGG